MDWSFVFDFRIAHLFQILCLSASFRFTLFPFHPFIFFNFTGQCSTFPLLKRRSKSPRPSGVGRIVASLLGRWRRRRRHWSLGSVDCGGRNQATTTLSSEVIVQDQGGWPAKVHQEVQEDQGDLQGLHWEVNFSSLFVFSNCNNWGFRRGIVIIITCSKVLS